MAKTKKVLYNNYNEVPVDHLIPILINREYEPGNECNLTDILNHLKVFDVNIDNVSIEVDTEYGYYNDSSSTLKVKYVSLENDLEFNIRKKNHQINVYNTQVGNLKKAAQLKVDKSNKESIEREQLKKLLRKYGPNL